MENQILKQIDKIIYQDSDLTLYTTKLKFKGENFDLNSIENTEIQITKSNRYIPWALIGVGLLMIILGSNIDSFDLVYFGALPISSGVTWLLWLVNEKYTLIVFANKEKLYTVTSRDKNHIDLLISLINTGKSDNSSVFTDYNKTEEILYQDEQVIVSNELYKFGEKAYAISLIEKVKAEFDPKSKRISIFLMVIGFGIFIYFGNKSRSDSETIFGLLVAAIGIYFWFKKQFTVSISIGNLLPFNSIVSKDLSYCKKVENAIHAAINKEALNIVENQKTINENN